MDASFRAAPYSATGERRSSPRPTRALAFAESPHLHCDNGPAPNPEPLSQLSFVPTPAGRQATRPGGPSARRPGQNPDGV